MNGTVNPNRRLNSLTDIARAFGLTAGADSDLIVRHFERQTNFTASLEIEEQPVLEHQDEVWEVRIMRALPHPRISLRQGSRGEWITAFGALPDDVAAYFRVKDIRGELVTTRSWKAWSRTNWTKTGGRQLRSRQGEIQALARIEHVARDTGMRRTALRVDPLDDAQASSEIRIQLPCPAKALFEVLDACRMSGMGLVA